MRLSPSSSIDFIVLDFWSVPWVRSMSSYFLVLRSKQVMFLNLPIQRTFSFSSYFKDRIQLPNSPPWANFLLSHLPPFLVKVNNPSTEAAHTKFLLTST